MFLIIASAFIGAACAIPVAWYAGGSSALLLVSLAGSSFALLGAGFNYINTPSGSRVTRASRMPHPDVVWC
jgi:hypothetical protein